MKGRLLSMASLAALGLPLGAVVAAVVAVAAGVATGSAPGNAAGESAWGEVRRADLVLSVPVSGTLAAVDSARLSPPPVAELWEYKIVFLAPEGTAVRRGQPVLGFDASVLERTLLDKVAERDSAQKQLDKQRADLALGQSDGRLHLAEAEADRRRAELAVAVPPELKSRSELAAARADLELAMRKIEYQRHRLRLTADAAAAQLRSLTEQRDRAAARVAEVRAAISRMRDEPATTSSTTTYQYKLVPFVNEVTNEPSVTQQQLQTLLTAQGSAGWCRPTSSRSPSPPGSRPPASGRRAPSAPTGDRRVIDGGSRARDFGCEAALFWLGDEARHAGARRRRCSLGRGHRISTGNGVRHGRPAKPGRSQGDAGEDTLPRGGRRCDGQPSPLDAVDVGAFEEVLGYSKSAPRARRRDGVHYLPQAI